MASMTTRYPISRLVTTIIAAMAILITVGEIWPPTGQVCAGATLVGYAGGFVRAELLRRQAAGRHQHRQ